MTAIKPAVKMTAKAAGASRGKDGCRKGVAAGSQMLSQLTMVEPTVKMITKATGKAEVKTVVGKRAECPGSDTAD